MIEITPETPYIIVTVVTPETDDPGTSGRVVNYPCAATITHEMLERTGPAIWTLRSIWRDRGYSLLQDLYAQERNSEGMAAWKAYVDAFQTGKRVVPFAKDKLPREVLRRQACGELDEAQALTEAKRTAPVTGKTRKHDVEAST